MVAFEHTVQDAVGLHARPAAALVRLCSGFASEIHLACGEKTADGKRIIGLMAIGASRGAVLHITVKGADEAAAADALRAFLTEHL